jgi:hypothetical protein
MPSTITPHLSWPGIAPADWLPNLQVYWRGAPENLTQPIFSGWNINVNSNNSTAPQTEVDVVAKHSYGRQLGRISDALELLIREGHGKAPKDKRLSDFLDMKREIDETKQEAAAQRVERIAQDLAQLKLQDRARYERLRDALRLALE